MAVVPSTLPSDRQVNGHSVAQPLQSAGAESSTVMWASVRTQPELGFGAVRREPLTMRAGHHPVHSGGPPPEWPSTVKRPIPSASAIAATEVMSRPGPGCRERPNVGRWLRDAHGCRWLASLSSQLSLIRHARPAGYSRPNSAQPSESPPQRVATPRPGLRPEGVALRAVRLTGRDEPGTVGGWLMTSQSGMGSAGGLL